jgi:hypothetical protein
LVIELIEGGVLEFSVGTESNSIHAKSGKKYVQNSTNMHEHKYFFSTLLFLKPKHAKTQCQIRMKKCPVEYLEADRELLSKATIL